MKTKGYIPTVNRAAARAIASKCLRAKTLRGASRILRAHALSIPDHGKGSWAYGLRRAAQAFLRGREASPIFAMDGNIKLPFVSFSALPEFTCPGMGACGSWCYSFKAWRYPQAFLRQLSNTLMLKHRPDLVRDDFLNLPEGITLRLYVDGDFSDGDVVAFWFNLLKERGDIRAFGYSKSWDEIYAYGQAGNAYPDNYMLNLSSGGLMRGVSRAQMLSLSITRGDFTAVPTDWKPKDWTKGNVSNDRFKDKSYHDDVRKNARHMGITGKIFSCPGSCGDCTAGAAACGSERFHGVNIILGIH